MKITNVSSGVNFQHKILLDIGASNPKGTLKITAINNNGKSILKEYSSNSFVNDTIKGFKDKQDFIDKITKIIKRTYDRVLLKDKSGEFPLSEKDKLLAGVAIFVPGTTTYSGNANTKIAFMPNLRDENNKSLKGVDFYDYAKSLKEQPANITGIEVDKENFNLVVTKDLGGTGVALAQMLAKNNMLNEGDYIMGIMTGGGFGSVDIKVKNNSVEFETSESSSYISGNFNIYDSILNFVDKIVETEDYKELENLKNNDEYLKEKFQILGKLGRHGVNVKSHIESFCNQIGRKDLIKLLQSVGDARIVEMNRLCVSEKDDEILSQLRSFKNEFIESA